MSFAEWKTFPENLQTCDECGGTYRIGEWPWCRGTGDHSRGEYGYEPMHEYVDEHLLPPDDPRAHDIGPNGAGEIVRGVRITSREERRAIMREQGIDWHGRRYGSGHKVEF